MGNRTAKTWQAQVSDLLSRAAELCVEHEVEMDPFVRGACSAYLEARPGMREELADRELAEKLDELRRAGRIATA